jgi:hypothetical protein
VASSERAILGIHPHPDNPQFLSAHGATLTASKSKCLSPKPTREHGARTNLILSLSLSFSNFCFVFVLAGAVFRQTCFCRFVQYGILLSSSK